MANGPMAGKKEALLNKLIMAEIIIHNSIEDEPCFLFKHHANGNSEFVGAIKSELALNDVRIQIKNNKRKRFDSNFDYK